jgi:hypothetical protein
MAKERYAVLDESVEVNGEWLHRCGTVLASQVVSHPIHDGPFPLSGSGQVYRETVPYCPKCHAKPAPHGAPIRRDPDDISEREILRRMRRRR